MGRVPFRIGGPVETWCMQIKKRGQRMSKIWNIRKGEIEVDKRETSLQKTEW